MEGAVFRSTRRRHETWQKLSKGPAPPESVMFVQGPSFSNLAGRPHARPRATKPAATRAASYRIGLRRPTPVTGDTSRTLLQRRLLTTCTSTPIRSQGRTVYAVNTGRAEVDRRPARPGPLGTPHARQPRPFWINFPQQSRTILYQRQRRAAANVSSPTAGASWFHCQGQPPTASSKHRTSRPIAAGPVLDLRIAAGQHKHRGCRAMATPSPTPSAAGRRSGLLAVEIAQRQPSSMPSIGPATYGGTNLAARRSLLGPCSEKRPPPVPTPTRKPASGRPPRN